jgi:hypothetical protein
MDTPPEQTKFVNVAAQLITFPLTGQGKQNIVLDLVWQKYILINSHIFGFNLQTNPNTLTKP